MDRENILQTTFVELKSIEDFSVTFEVDFMGEVYKDYGGPRKELIRLVNSAMKADYKILTMVLEGSLQMIIIL